MTDALEFVFLRHALYAGILISIACGIIGTLVIVNKLSYIAGGVAHAAYGGLGLAVFFGLPPAAGTLPFSVVSALAMGYVAGRNREATDAAIGTLWAFGMAAGILLIELTPGYHADLMSYLFGSIMAVSTTDLLLMAVLNVVIILFVALFYKELVAFSYDEEYALISGIPVTLLRYLLLIMVACSVVMLIQAVGLILVIALFTIPATIAQLFSKNIRNMMALAVASGLVITFSGIFISYFLNLTAGATIILTACVLYGLCYAVKRTGFLRRTKKAAS